MLVIVALVKYICIWDVANLSLLTFDEVLEVLRPPFGPRAPEPVVDRRVLE